MEDIYHLWYVHTVTLSPEIWKTVAKVNAILEKFHATRIQLLLEMKSDKDVAAAYSVLEEIRKDGVSSVIFVGSLIEVYLK